MNSQPVTSEKINELILQQYIPGIPGEAVRVSNLLNSELGVYITPEAVTSRVKRMKATGSQFKVSDLRETKSGVAPLVESPISYEDRILQARSQLLEKQRATQERQEIMEQARFENLLDTIREAVTPVTPLYSVMPIPQIDYTDESAVLVLSDLHFGKLTGTYNMAIALDRFINLIDNVLRTLKERSKIRPITQLHILWTGDIVDGEQIYATHGSHIDDHVVNQIFKSLEIVVPQIMRFVDAGYVVHNSFVRGNHGRVTKFHHESTNWDYVYGLVMETMLKEVQNMTFKVTPSWHQVVNVRGNRILQWHGHQIKMHLNLPWYSLTNRISRWAVSEELEDFDISVSGHFHSSSMLNWNEKKLFTNGTMVSGDQFALEFIGLSASESQHLFGVDESGVTWMYEVGFTSE